MSVGLFLGARIKYFCIHWLVSAVPKVDRKELANLNENTDEPSHIIILFKHSIKKGNK